MDGVKTLKTGEYLFLQGQPGHEIYFLKSGSLDVILSPAKMELTAEDVEKHGQIIERFDQPGQLIGEISPILNCPRTASLRATNECALLVADMRPGAFENAFRTKPTLGIKIAEELARRISKTNERLKKQDMLLLRFLEEVRVALAEFWNGNEPALSGSQSDMSGHLFAELSRISTMLPTLPADLPVSLALTYDQAGSFFSFFGGTAFQAGGGGAAHMAGAADALSKVQGKKYASGEVLCSNGEDAKELFILLQGRLSVVVGRRTVQTIEGRGNVVGEMAFLLKTRRTASVIAADPCTVLIIPYEKMEPLFKRVPQLLMLMLRQLANRLLQVDLLLQKSTWRNLFFGEFLPAFHQTLKSAGENFPASVQDAVKDAAHRTLAMVDEAVNTMVKAKSQEASGTPFTMDELVAEVKAREITVEEISETPPDQDSHQPHTDFVMSLADNRCAFGPPETPLERFAEFLKVEGNILIRGRIIGKPGQGGTYAEILVTEEGTDESRRKLVEQISNAIGVSYIMLSMPPQRWLYQFQSGGGGVVAAESIPHAGNLLRLAAKTDRESLTPLEKSRIRRLYLEAATSILESHWSAPGQFTEPTAAETALMQFGDVGDSGDVHKLDPPPGRTVLPMLEFAKRAVVQLAGGDSAVMGDSASAKAKLPEKEKQIADLMEARKKAYADHQVPYEDPREGPLLQQIDKMAQLVRLKEKGGLSGDALRDFATAEKDTEKLLDERNSFITQKLKGDAGRKALTQIKGVEDQIRTAIREKLDLIEMGQQPEDAQKEKDPGKLLPITLLNAFRDLLFDFYARIRQTVQPENMDVLPILTDDVRIYSGRDVGIALQKVFDKDKLLISGRECPPILRIPGEGYSIYSEEWNVIIAPLYSSVDSFQTMAHAVGEWRWSLLPDAEKKKYQKALKGGSSIKLDQLRIFFAREYRLLLDEKEVDEGSQKFIQTVLATAPAAPAAAKAK